MHLPLKDVQSNYAEITRERYVMAFAANHPLSGKLYHKEGGKYPYIDPREAAGEKSVLSFPYQRVRRTHDPVFCCMEDRFEAFWTFVVAYPGDVALSGPAKAFIRMTQDTY